MSFCERSWGRADDGTHALYVRGLVRSNRCTSGTRRTDRCLLHGSTTRFFGTRPGPPKCVVVEEDTDECIYDWVVEASDSHAFHFRNGNCLCIGEIPVPRPVVMDLPMVARPGGRICRSNRISKTIPCGTSRRRIFVGIHDRLCQPHNYRSVQSHGRTTVLSVRFSAK